VDIAQKWVQSFVHMPEVLSSSFEFRSKIILRPVFAAIFISARKRTHSVPLHSFMFVTSKFINM